MHPALGYRAFCEPDRADIVTALAAFPDLYPQLHDELGEASSQTSPVRSPFGPQLPVRVDVDAVMRKLVVVLTSWEQRVRTVAQLADPPKDNDPAAVVARASTTLHRHVDALLSLEPEWMSRTVPAPRAGNDMVLIRREHWDPDANVLTGDVTVLDRLDGAHAGLEILHLHYLCRSVLGEIEPRPENLPGVACYRCGHKALRRADPPAADESLLMYSQCKVCGHQLTEPAYRDHVKRLAALVGGRKLTPILELQTATRCVVAGDQSTYHWERSRAMPAPSQTARVAGLFHVRERVSMQITRADGYVNVAQAAQLCGVEQVTVRHWINRGYWSDVLGCRVHLPVAKREGRTIWLDPVEVAKAEHATAKRARRVIVPTPVAA